MTLLNNSQIIDHFIRLLRKIADSSQSYWSNWEIEVREIFNIDVKTSKISFILDALYLLEDTQLAKDNFSRFNLSGPTKYKDIGEVFLRLYGIYNACYLQKQAILTLFEIVIPKEYSNVVKLINKLELFEYRKIFASHTSNVGHKKAKHSYILGRDGLDIGHIEGYSTNKGKEIDFKKGILSSQIEEWDKKAIEMLNQISDEVVSNYNRVFANVSDRLQWELVLGRIKKLISGKSSFAGDVFNLESIEISLTGPKEE